MSKNRQAEEQFRVDFFGIGFPKCGTTWVSHHLDAHPEIGFSNIKETNYFATGQLVKMFPDDFETMRRLDSQAGYHRQFTNKDLVTGEFSVYYVYEIETLQNIRQYNADAKIIVCIRNPVDAAISNHRYIKNSLRATDFADDIIDEFDNSDYLLNKYSYSRHLNDVYSVFEPDNIHLVDFDEIKTSPTSTLKQVYRFLNVDDSYIPANSQDEVYATGQLRANKLTELAKPVVATLRRVGAHGVIDSTHNRLLRYLPAADKTTYSSETRNILQQRFAEDLTKTATLVADQGIDISVTSWTKTSPRSRAGSA